jgi:hypothetical protein
MQHYLFSAGIAVILITAVLVSLFRYYPLTLG